MIVEENECPINIFADNNGKIELINQIPFEYDYEYGDSVNLTLGSTGDLYIDWYEYKFIVKNLKG